MRRWLVCALAFALPVSALARPFTAEDLVRLDRVSDPQLSPDGKTVAFSVRHADVEANRATNAIWRVPSNGSSAPERLSGVTANDHSPRWSADGSALFFLSSRSGSSQVWAMPLGGGEARQVTALPLDVGSFALSPRGDRVLVSVDVFLDCDTLDCTARRVADKAAGKRTGTLYQELFVRHWDTWIDGRRSQLFALKLDGLKAVGDPVHVSRGVAGDVPSKPFGDAHDYAISPDGTRVAFSARLGGSSEAWSTNFDIYEAGLDDTAPARNLTSANPAWDANPVYSPDGRKLAYKAMTRPGFEADRFGLRLMELSSGEIREIAADWDRSAGGVAFSSDGRTLYTDADDLGQHRIFAIDLAKQNVRALGGEGWVIGYSVGRDRVVFARDDLDSPADLFVQSIRGGRIDALTEFNRDLLAEVEFGHFEQFSFKGWNDETVHGWVTRPAGYSEGTRYPVAFLIHGGPQGSMANHFHYRWNPQTYAGQGFAAVMIDFHGSTGYGQAFTDAISGDWGGKPLEDLQKGWQAAQQQFAFLDGSRACALGASYGGYMINWIAGNWSDGFKCLVNHDGVFDERMMYYATEELWFTEWEHDGFPAYAKPELYERHNPVNHVANWKTPMLVVHGELDHRVPITQGLATFTALQRRGIPSQFLYFPDENHWVLKPQNSIQWHETVNAWLKRWTAQ
jgi:dipeptidyl aminopeptidase/acylaminoacyl peptidase